jgi:hypothetical protein
VQSFSRALYGALVELYMESWQGFVQLYREPLAELCAELSAELFSIAFSRALCKSRVELHAEPCAERLVKL